MSYLTPTEKLLRLSDAVLEADQLLTCGADSLPAPRIKALLLVLTEGAPVLAKALQHLLLAHSDAALTRIVEDAKL
jgi:hypothetical protein